MTDNTDITELAGAPAGAAHLLCAESAEASGLGLRLAMRVGRRFVLAAGSGRLSVVDGDHVIVDLDLAIRCQRPHPR